MLASYSPFKNCFQRKPQSISGSITRRYALASHSAYSLAIHSKEASNHPNTQHCVKADSSTRIRPVLLIKDRKGQPFSDGHLIPFLFALYACYECNKGDRGWVKCVHACAHIRTVKRLLSSYTIRDALRFYVKQDHLFASHLSGDVWSSIAFASALCGTAEYIVFLLYLLWR